MPPRWFPHYGHNCNVARDFFERCHRLRVWREGGVVFRWAQEMKWSCVTIIRLNRHRWSILDDSDFDLVGIDRRLLEGLHTWLAGWLDANRCHTQRKRCRYGERGFGNATISTVASEPLEPNVCEHVHKAYIAL